MNLDGGVNDGDAVTCDRLFQGNLSLYQDRRGYRFSIDAVLLAGLTRVRATDRIMELGTGCGVVLLALAMRQAGSQWVGVEIQKHLAALAVKNAEINGLADRVRILCMDWKDVQEVFPPEGFDLVVSNPPYRRLRSGRMNPNLQKAMARHEICGAVQDMLQSASYLLRKGGRLAVIYPASRLDDLVMASMQAGLRPKRLTLIHSHHDAPAKLVHMECGKGSGQELQVMPPFFIYQKIGGYTPAMLRLHTGCW
ncbi:tRNA1(Val) (adenine(37)-N6)-methyltransferase [Desulfosoma caldarium]|uniref:tRNA1(Val) (adenine(37)-N6)-methyltransferase n=1 Tax=Desulfosoma caldarium TaxID=610254 RepID=UPI0014751527|nr:methyltransferase [Desulfosoma caldarium]